MKNRTTILMLMACLLMAGGSAKLRAQNQYEIDFPIIIACDWDRPPYEFRNDNGQPDGYHVDIIKTLLTEMDIPFEFKMDGWSDAVKNFEENKADLIFDNVRRYNNREGFAATSYVMSYYRISVATPKSDTTDVVPLSALENPEDAMFYHGGYTTLFLKRMKADMPMSYRTPNEALTGLAEGRYKYFVWGEEALKWKIKELNLEDEVTLHDVNIPMGEIHLIGHNKRFIDAIEDHFSRMKQNGEIDALYAKWFRPEAVPKDHSPIILYITLGILVLTAIIYLFVHTSRINIQRITRNANDTYNIMLRSLDMGRFHVLQYDIAKNRLTNRYGNLLPEQGMTMEAFTARIHPKDLNEFTQKMTHLLNGRIRKCNLEKRWNAGTEENPKWLRIYGTAIVEQDASGRPEYVVSIINDITHNIEEEKMALDVQHRMDSLFNIPKLGISFHDKEGWLITLNDQMKEICGFSNPENKRWWVNRNLDDVSLFRDAFPQEKRDQMVQVCRVMHDPDMGLHNYIECCVMPVKRTNGETTQYLTSAIKFNEEQEVQAETYSRRKQLQSTRHEAELFDKRMHQLLVDFNTYIYDYDLDTRTMRFSFSPSCTEYTITFDEYLDMVDDDQRETAAERMANHEDPNNTCRHFKRTVTGDEPQWLYFIGRQKYDEHGKHIGSTGMVIVVTELIETKRRLAETTELANDSIRLKGLFLASMTHELRTPLNAIVGFTTILDSVETAEERKEYINIIHNSCDMLERLIDDLLEASSITSDGLSTIHAEEVDFVKSFESICLTLQQRVAQAGLEFDKESPYERFFTTIDLARIQQIITNFVANAVKFTAQGHIKLGYRYERHGLYIYCEDTGVGIPKDKQEIIFDRFIKLDEFIQGTGMGLSICKCITERLGGQIGVKSEGEGTGSTFWIWIPCDRRLRQSEESKE